MLEIKSCFRKCSDCYLLENSNKTVCNFNFIGKLDLEYTEEEIEKDIDISLLDDELDN